MVLIAGSAEEVVDLLRNLDEVTQSWGLSISVPKTKLMCVRPGQDSASVPPLPVVVLRGETVEWVDVFKYLGTMVQSNGRIGKEVDSRVAKAIGKFAQLRPILLNRAISLGTRMLFYKAFLPPTLTYGCESWPISGEQARRLNARHMGFLRSMLGITRLDRRPNVQVLQQCGVLSIQDTISRHRMRWLGHLMRMDSCRLPNQVFQGTLPPLSNGRTGRGRGKPGTTIRKGYMDDVAFLSVTGGANFRECRGPEAGVWGVARDRAAWKQLINDTWATHAS